MALTYMVVDSFSIIFLMILYASSRGMSVGLTENRSFCSIILMTIAALFCDMLAWQLDGHSGALGRSVLWLANILCYQLSGAMALNWFYYTGLKLGMNHRLTKAGWALIALPCVFLVVVSALSPWTKWLFYIDEYNTYRRGALFAIQMIIPFGYMLAAAACAIARARRERLRQQRKECWYLASFVVFPLLGGLLQLAVYGLSLAWPCAALSLMLVYVNLQSQRISQDALTGLNNRGQFDQRLYGCIERGDSEPPFALFMLDVDDFKRINDQFGHIAGDAALISAADILRAALGDTNAFLARYGGDEFALILPCRDEEQAEIAARRIEEEARARNARADAPPYALEFSIGFVCSDSRRFRSYQDMIIAADAHMYLQKQRHKAARAAGRGVTP